MQHDAARPKKLRAEDEQSTTQESMRGSQPSVRRNPSTDQKKKRRQLQRSAVGGAPAERLAQRFHETYERLAPSFGYKTREDSSVSWDEVPEANKSLMVAVCAELLSTGSIQSCAACQAPSAGRCGSCGCTLVTTATVLPTNAERLQAGHVLRLPSGQRVKVKAIRPHENSGQHVYLDTDIGTSVVDRKHQFHVVQGDAATRGAPFRQQTNPQAPGQFNTGLAESTEAPKAPGAAGKCPSCGKGPLSNHGGKMVCRNCGYSSSGGDTDFGEAGYRRAAAYEHDGRTAVVRRAQALVERTGQ